MAEVLVDFDTPIRYGDDIYRARAVGRLAGDRHMWEGWLEFVPAAGGPGIVGTTETTQPEREHLVYWATGLTPVYLAGALSRAMRSTTVRVHVTETPYSDHPAPRAAAAAPPAGGPDAVLDPFDVGARSLDILRQELGALNRPRLLNIIAAYDLKPEADDFMWFSV
jgi:hypothetical protein